MKVQEAKQEAQRKVSPKYWIKWKTSSLKDKIEEVGSSMKENVKSKKLRNGTCRKSGTLPNE